MFTVKQISISGAELVIAAKHVFYRPDDDGVQKADQNVPRRILKKHVKAITPTGEEEVFFSGTVFVMNDEGATVSRWDLGASQVPLGDDVTGINAHRALVSPVVTAAA